MKGNRLSRFATSGAVIAMLLAFFASPAGAANNGDIWLTNSSASGAGHAHEPHLTDSTIYLHGSDLVSTSGTFDIASIPGTGSGKIIWSGKAWAASGGTDVVASFSGSALVADAIAQDHAVANPNQGFHFKITVYDGRGETPGTATAQTSNSNDIKTKTFWVMGPQTPKPTASLTITKTADATSTVSGGNIGFTITVGPKTGGFANDVAITDSLPAGPGINWTISPAYTGQGSCKITGSVPSQKLTCSVGDLNGTSVSVHVQSATVAGVTAALAPLTLTNKACASFDLGENKAGEDQAQCEPGDVCATALATITPAPPALTITKTPDAALVPAGTSVGFTIAVGNTGPGVALGVTLSDPLPAVSGESWSISPAYSGAGTCSITGSAGSQTLACSLGNMTAGASDEVHITSPTPSGSTIALTNTATASATNNAPVSATAKTGTTIALLTITKVADSATTTAGNPVGFTITVGNTGTTAATDVTMTDPLPSFAGESWSISPAYSGTGTCAISGSAPNQTLSCSFGNLAPGASVSVHVVTQTPTTLGLTLTNVATAVAGNNGPVTATAVTRTLVTSVLGTSITNSPSPSPSPSTQVLGEQINRPQATTPSAATLPFTGGPAIILYFLAAALLLAGGVLLLISRARREPMAATASSWARSIGTWFDPRHLKK